MTCWSCVFGTSIQCFIGSISSLTCSIDSISYVHAKWIERWYPLICIFIGWNTGERETTGVSVWVGVGGGNLSSIGGHLCDWRIHGSVAGTALWHACHEVLQGLEFLGTAVAVEFWPHVHQGAAAARVNAFCKTILKMHVGWRGLRGVLREFEGEQERGRRKLGVLSQGLIWYECNHHQSGLLRANWRGGGWKSWWNSSKI